MRHCTWGLMIVAVLCTACHSEERQIKEVAYEYGMATANYRIEDAEKYCTAETRETTMVMARSLLAMVDSTYIASDTPAKIEITSVHRTSDTTAIAHYHKLTPRKDFTDSLSLRRREGKWLVHMPL